MTIKRALWSLGIGLALGGALARGQDLPGPLDAEAPAAIVPAVDNSATELPGGVLPAQATAAPGAPQAVPPLMPRTPLFFPPPRPPVRAVPVAAVPPAPWDPTRLANLPESARPEMLGDAPPLSLLFRQPKGLILLPSTRGFKIDDNENPLPQDRTYVSVNYFGDLNSSVNRRLHADIRNINLNRETIGVEKAFLDDAFSVGFRLPVNTVSAQSGIPQLNGTHTTWGDLSVILKGVIYEGGDNDFRLSGGLAITPPTGADSLFGDSPFVKFRTTTLQPYLGYVWSEGRWYLQGFSSIDVPMDGNDATLLFNDVSVRYDLYRNPNPNGAITSITPTLELHVNTPLNHSGVLRSTDPAGTPDLVDTTVGVDFRFFRKNKLVLGFVTPLTGPSPLAYEFLSQIKLGF